MAVQPNQNPVEPDTPEQRDPIHHPHRQDHPGPDQGDPPEEQEDVDSEPWWM